MYSYTFSVIISIYLYLVNDILSFLMAAPSKIKKMKEIQFPYLIKFSLRV